MKNFLILFILSIQFFLVSTVKAENVTLAESVINPLAPTTYNEFFLNEENYGIIGNKILNFETIKNGTASYCKSNFGLNYYATHHYLNSAVVFFYCSKSDEYAEYNLSPSEKGCVKNLELNLKNLYEDECSNMDLVKLKQILEKVTTYRSSINKLKSNSFILELLTEKMYDKIRAFEVESTYNKIKSLSNTDLQIKMSQLENPLYKEILVRKKKMETMAEVEMKLKNIDNSQIIKLENLIIAKNIETCKKYKFVEGSKSYFDCLISLIEITHGSLNNN